MSSITTYLADGLDGGHVLSVVEDGHVPVHGLVAGVPVVNGGPHLENLYHLFYIYIYLRMLTILLSLWCIIYCVLCSVYMLSMIKLTLLKSGGAAARLTSGYQRLVRSGTTATSVDIIVDICAELSQFYNLIQFSSDSTGSELKCVFIFICGFPLCSTYRIVNRCEGASISSRVTRPARARPGHHQSIIYSLYLLSLIQTSTALCRWVYTSSAAHWESAWST